MAKMLQYFDFRRSNYERPYSNWVWNDAKNDWWPPVASPSSNVEEYRTSWDQEKSRWSGNNGDVSVYWDPDTSSWKNE